VSSKVIYVCDACGKKIEPDGRDYLGRGISIRYMTGPAPDRYIDLCLSCFEKTGLGAIESINR
jgi:hypothetical protein